VEFKLACPNGQWVAGKDRAAEAMRRLTRLGFQFEIVERHGTDFVKTCNEPVIELKDLEALIELQQVVGSSLVIQDRKLIIDDMWI
jgi:hypothetical protein